MEPTSVEQEQQRLVGRREGWLLKWTNYMKGFQQRYFVVDHGILSYYRTVDEMAHTCRGTLVLKDASIELDSGYNFTVWTGASKKTGQNFHLRATNERERQEWLTALELSRAFHNEQGTPAAASSKRSTTGGAAQGPGRGGAPAASSSSSSLASGAGRGPKRPSTFLAVPSIGHDSDESGDDYVSDDETVLDPESGRMLGAKLTQVQQAHENVYYAAKKLNSKIEALPMPPEATEAVKASAMKLQHDTAGLLSASSDFFNEMMFHQKKWMALLRVSETKRKQLEESLEALALEHRRLQRNANRAHIKGGLLSEEEYEGSDEEFYDAEDGADHESDELDTGVSSTHDAFEVAEPQAVEITVNASPVSVKRESFPESPPEMASSSIAELDSVPRKAAEVKEKPPQVVTFTRRTSIPVRPDKRFNLWSLMKNCIGKDLSKIPMPVHFAEPLTFLQRLTEDLEYKRIIDEAATKPTAQERMCHVAAFTVASFANVTRRTSKPFNPLLGETFELDRRVEDGYRAFCEQVSHHPPIAAFHAESDKWTFWQEFSMKSSFRGKYLEITPTGIAHLIFKDTGDHFTWTKVSTTVHNIIVGTLWVDQHGTMTITNHTNGDTCDLKYIAYSYFTSGESRRVVGKVKDVSGKVHYNVQGTWDQRIDYFPADNSADRRNAWTRNIILKDSPKMYGFTKMAMTLNEVTPTEEGCAKTDARFRPDKNIMETQDFDRANKVKVKLEEAQRARRRKMEKEKRKWRPVWFDKLPDPAVPGRLVHQYNGKYWPAKEAGEFDRFDLLDLYDV